MAKKDLSAQQRFDKANKDINKAMNKRKKLERRAIRTKEDNEEIERLTRTIAQKIEEKEFAKKQVENPQNVIDNSNRVFAPTVKIKSDNNETKELHGHYYAGTNKTKKQNKSTQKKKSKVRLIFSLIGILCLVIATAVISVKITNCVNDNKDNSSAIQHEIVI